MSGTDIVDKILQKNGSNFALKNLWKQYFAPSDYTKNSSPKLLKVPQVETNELQSQLALSLPSAHYHVRITIRTSAIL